MKQLLLNLKLRSILTAFLLSFLLTGQAQYCDTYLDDAALEHITNVNFAGINNSSADDSGGPVDYTSEIAEVSPGGSYLLSVSIVADQFEYVFAFIDWDQDGVLDGTDEVYTVASDVADDGMYTLDIEVPAGAVAGNTRMRVMIVYDNSSPDPCIEDFFGYGEVEDYTVNVTTTACSAVAPGNTTSTSTSVCGSTIFLLGLQNQVTGTGITYQWQSSSDGVTFSDIAGATSSSYVTTQSAATHYRCEVTCDAGATANSTPILVSQNSFLNCYCESSPIYPDAEDILNVTLGSLNNSSECDETGDGNSVMNQYSDYTAVTAPSLARGVTYPFSVEIGACFDAYETMTKVYIDFNQDGDFEDADEEVYVTDNVVDGPHTETATILIPMGATLGTTRMRVVLSETTFESDITPCTNEYYYAGETEDYFVTIAPAPACAQPTSLTWLIGDATSGDFSWTPGGSETEWNVEYGAVGFTPGSGTPQNVTPDPEATISGLTPNTLYHVYVQAVCGSDESFWTGPLSFDTYNLGQYLEADAACGPGFIDISATGTLYNLEDDDEAPLTLPFPFYYQGALYTQATLGNNGAIQLGTSSANIDWDNVSMDNAPTGLYPWWDDISGSGPGVWTATTGTAPNRKFIIQWQKDHIDVFGNPFNFELIFDEATMEIYYVYDDVLGGDPNVNYGGSATIGAAGAVDIEISYFDDEYLKNNECVHFYYTNCPKPADLEFSNITIDEFSMDWVEGLSNETEWNVEFGMEGFLPGTGTMLTDITSSDQQIPGLDPITTYEVHVYAVCANGEISMPLIGTVQTLPLCADPYALYGTAAEDSVFAEWQWTETQLPLEGFNLQYGETGFPLYGAGSHDMVADGMNFEDTIFNAPVFMAGVTYDVYVQAFCSADDTSNFVGPFTVTMPLTNDTVCYAETLLTDGTVYTFTNDGATVNNTVVSNQEQTIAPPNAGLQSANGWGNTTISFSTWFKFTAPASGQVRISGTDQGFDGQMAVYEVGNCAQFSTFDLLAANDNEIGGTSLAPNFTVCGLTPGNTYYLMHDSYSTSATGTYSIKISAINLEAGVNGSLAEICSGSTFNLFDGISGNDANGMWIPTIPSVALIDDSIFNSAGLAYQIFDFEYRMVDGCAYDSIVTSVKVFPPSSAGTDGSIIVCRNEPFNLLEGLTGNVDMDGTWYNPNSVVVPDGNATADNFPGQYNFRYIVGNGVCPNDTSKVIVSVGTCNYLGLDETAFEGFSLYPNPTEGTVYVANSGSSEVFSYEVLDLNGRKVMMKENAINGTAVTEIDLNAFETGVYMIHVFNGSSEKTFRVVVK